MTESVTLPEKYETLLHNLTKNTFPSTLEWFGLKNLWIFLTIFLYVLNLNYNLYDLYELAYLHDLEL